MRINRITAVCFSPVGSTRRVVERIAENLADSFQIPSETLDFTLPAAREKNYAFSENALVVFGVPTYAGRIPNKILPFVQTGFRGQGTPAIAVVTFGNRSFDDALIELRNELAGNGFVPVAAAGLAAEHVFTAEIGTGRPDAEDQREIAAFCGKTAEKLRLWMKEPQTALLSVAGREPVGPYYTPLRADGQPAKFLKARPVTDLETCAGCGKCMEVCPMGSVKLEDGHSVTNGICIKCQACIRFCPVKARFFSDEDFLSHTEMLRENYTRRASNAFFV